jgi:hypothetical protein
MGDRKDWMTDDQWECAILFADLLGGFHHTFNIKEWGAGIQMCVPGSWSTYDFNQLTRLVLLAHDRAIRIEIGPASPSYFRVMAHRRKRDSARMWERHPTIEQAIDIHRR